ncbi:Aerobic respiration control sensor protein ArcB [Salinivirga cyanobacteriivorans]|uniref:histidine kinase n=1 Tax=Salinivirga cyanobacteriivorans TaxID=1307839 RepID=A0A0S2HWX5_9BACT|nr:PAS domain S-box protein [Salinivirga cyanobacteriivorans]ALO14563.1 Aerobic respiration control sensor protein ArcB [Salinivirga cyanobacteriivorans]
MKPTEKQYDNLIRKINELESKAAFFHQFAEESFDIEFFRDLSGKIVYANKAFERITGYKASDIVSGKITEKDFVYTDDYRLVQSIISQSLEGQVVKDRSFRILTFCGDLRYVHLNANPVFKANKLVGVRTSIRDITNQAEIQELLKTKKLIRESEKRLRETQRLAKIGHWEYDLVNDKLCWSSEVYTIFGKERSKFEVTYNNFLSLVHPDDQKQVDNAFKGHLKVNAPYNVVHRIVSYGEQIRYINERCTTEYDSKGKPLSSRGTVWDITENINVQNQLLEAKEKAEESEKFMLNIFEHIPNMVFLKDANELRFVQINEAGEEITGYSREEIIGKNDYDLFPRQQADFFTQKDRAVFKADGTLIVEEEKLKTKSAKTKILYTKKIAIKDSRGRNRYLLGISEDITEKKRIAKALAEAKEFVKESEQRLSTYINSIPDIICYKDGKGRWLLANEADLNLFRLEGVDYFGKTDLELSEYTHPIYKEAFVACVDSDEQAWTQRKLSTGIEIIPMPDGKTKVYEVNKVPVFHANGRRKGLAVIGRDITALHESNKNLKIAKDRAEESDRLKTAFLQNLSHEIRTPMNAIIGFSNMLSLPEITRDKQSKFIELIQDSSSHLLQIVSDVLTMAALETKQEELYLKQVVLNTIMDNMYATMKVHAKDKNLDFKLKKGLTDKQSLILIDQSKLKQVLFNLVMNAIKFTNEGYVETGYMLKNGMLEFYVRDTGIGIPRQYQKKIFKRFSQADKFIQEVYGGTGLGLSISKGLVELMNGKIWVESEMGKGSVFYFTIPFQPAN